MTGKRVLKDAGEGRARQRWRRLAFLAGAGTLLAVLAAVPPALSAASKLQQARAAFTSAARAAAGLRLADADAAFVRAGRLAASAEASLRSPLTALDRGLPVLGENLSAARDLATGAQIMAEAGRQATAAGRLLAPAGPSSSTVAPAGGGSPADGGALSSMPLGGAQAGSLQQAQAHLARATLLAETATAQVRPSAGPLASRIVSARREFTARGRQAVSDLGRARDATGLTSVIFGADQPRTWFLAIENPVEQRGGGGLIGAFGILRGEAGRLQLTRFDSDVGLPPVIAPQAAPAEVMARYDRFGSRTIWQNVNMSPDFPSAAGLIAGMWQRGSGTSVDGVIAIDAEGIDSLLGAVGPVTLTNGDSITSENFLPIALNQAYVRFPVKAGRVDYLLEVGRQVWSRLAGGRFGNIRALGTALSDSVQGKHLQVWIPGQEAVLTRLGVSGALAGKPGEDYLCVVGQNATGNKLDYYAQRSISYTATLDPAGGVTGRVSVELANRTPVTVVDPGLTGAAPAGYNRSYESVYLPPGAGILDAQVNGMAAGVESESERGLHVVSHVLEALPGGRSTLALHASGTSTSPGHYRLVLQHQPVLNPDNFHLELILPEGDSVEGRLPPGTIERGRRVIWEAPLVSDTEFVVNYGGSGK